MSSATPDLDHARIIALAPTAGVTLTEVRGSTWATLATDPPLTAGQLASLHTAYDDQLAAEAAARTQAQADAATTRTLVVQTAQTAVGVNLTALTAAQRNSLLAVVLYKNGALNPDGTVKPLSVWT